jgi:flagellar hook-basal body complex protein FliE
MSINISGLSSISQISTDVAAPAAGDGGTSSFKDIFNGAIGEVENSRSSASKSVEQFLSGDGGDLHSTILATQRADLEFQMFMQVRNKVVSAYQEIMKMPM